MRYIAPRLSESMIWRVENKFCKRAVETSSVIALSIARKLNDEQLTVCCFLVDQEIKFVT